MAPPYKVNKEKLTKDLSDLGIQKGFKLFFVAGTVITRRFTPAIWAGIAFINTELGYAAVPPGT